MTFENIQEAISFIENYRTKTVNEVKTYYDATIEFSFYENHNYNKAMKTVRLLLLSIIPFLFASCDSFEKSGDINDFPAL